MYAANGQKLCFLTVFIIKVRAASPDKKAATVPAATGAIWIAAPEDKAS